MTVILQPPVQLWECPNCTVTDATRGQTNRFHTCRGLNGITAPMVPAGSDCRVVAVLREDYVGSERVQYDGDGNPVMAVVTQRPDGSNDVMVNAPTAYGAGSS